MALEPFEHIPDELLSGMKELLARTEERHVEHAGAICYDERSGRYFIGSWCSGDEESCSIDALSCPPGTVRVGDFHTHTDRALLWSWEDIDLKSLAIIYEGLKFNCLAAEGMRYFRCHFVVPARAGEGEVALTDRIYDWSGKVIDPATPEYEGAVVDIVEGLVYSSLKDKFKEVLEQVRKVPDERVRREFARILWEMEAENVRRDLHAEACLAMSMYQPIPERDGQDLCDMAVEMFWPKYKEEFLEELLREASREAR